MAGATVQQQQEQPPDQLPSSSSSSLLVLPLELRLQIYQYTLFLPAQALTVRSHFIRAGFRNVFMVQQLPSPSFSSDNTTDTPPTTITTTSDSQIAPRPTVALLRTSRQIHAEAAPVLYSAPRWACGCRVEALATQIGHVNFGHIRRMSLDVDDLDLLVECARRERQRRVHRSSGFAMQAMTFVSESQSSSSLSSSPLHSSKKLDFSNLEVLEVEGYQSAALLRNNNRGGHRVRIEALRLCELAAELLGVHPQLKTLLQRSSRRGSDGGGGADARDMTLGRVKWRFVTATNAAIENGESLTAVTTGPEAEGEEEHVVDLRLLRSTLEFMLKEDEGLAQSESSLPVAWTSSATGRFHLYPFLQTA